MTKYTQDWVYTDVTCNYLAIVITIKFVHKNNDNAL